MTVLEPSVFKVSGPVLVGNASSVVQQGMDAIAAGVTRIDFSGVTEVDSSGLAVILAWLREASERSVTLSFSNTPATLYTLADVYGVTELIPNPVG